MLWLEGLADACCGKVIWSTHATARRTTWNILRQGEPGRFCSEWASNVVFDERVTIPYISDGVMTWCFLWGFFRCECFFRLRCLGITTFDTFFEQTNTYVVGGFVFASVLHPAPFLCNAELPSFLRFA